MFVKNILFGVSYIQSLLQLMYIHSLKFVLPKSVCQSRLSVSFKSINITTMLKVRTQWERIIQKHQVEWKNQCYHLFNGPIQGKIYDKGKVGLTLRECMFQSFSSLAAMAKGNRLHGQNLIERQVRQTCRKSIKNQKFSLQLCSPQWLL